jgi:hypothetical protein
MLPGDEMGEEEERGRRSPHRDQNRPVEPFF